MRANTETHAERTGVVGDARVTVRVAAGEPLKDTDYQLAEVSRNERHDAAPTIEAVTKFIEERWPTLSLRTSQAQGEVRPAPKKRPVKVEVIEERKTTAIAKAPPPREKPAPEKKAAKAERKTNDGEDEEEDDE
ncbi:MAG: hypothetical protein HY261_01485 [Chloroflexi bacterium]|nr:hypothetical protein [Chloroflexota bacterium]